MKFSRLYTIFIVLNKFDDYSDAYFIARLEVHLAAPRSQRKRCRCPTTPPARGHPSAEGNRLFLI